jgi:gliding motility-associated-like protein
VITVSDTPNVVIAGFTLCSNEPPYQLPNGAPAGGVWSGTGVSGAGPYIFDPAVGAQTLTYTVTVNNCTGSGSVLANVLPPPVANAGIDTTLCDQSIPFPLVGNYANAGTWSGGAPYLTQNPAQFTPAAGNAGSWTLTYSYTQGNCSDTDQVVITVVPLTITANAGNDTSICINSGSVQLGAAPMQGSWTPTAYLSAGGVFDPMLAGVGIHTAEFCVGVGTCRDCDQRSVTVQPPPALTVSPSTGVCVYEPVLDLFENPTGGTWSGSTGITDAALGLFDPGQASLGDNVLTYTYTDPNTNCTNTAQLTITVSQQPVASFTNPPIACQFADFTFQDQSSSDVSQWAWYPGDNTGPYSAQNFTYTYQDTGTYTVTLIAGTGNCTDTITGSVTVWPAPVIDLSLDTTQGCGPLMVNFQNNSTGPGVQYTWDFDLGPGSIAQFPPPLDYPAGVMDDTTYVITLSGSNLCGTFSDQATVTVFPEPTAYFGPDFESGCSPWPVTFSNVSVGHADTFEWNWGDGTPNTLTNDSLVVHTFLTDSIPVVRTITLTATNACGVDSATYDVLVLPNTITAFFNTDTTQGCAPLTVNFTQYSIGVTNWHWDFGDNNFSTAYSPTHTYPDPGTYTATLFGDNGCSYDTVSVTITVEPSPIVNFSFAPDPVCGNVPVQFTNLTSDIAGVVWTFGDGDTSDLTDPQHQYASAGTYQVTLFVESTLNECTASITQPVTISPVPVAAFTVSDSIFCAPDQITFDNTSTGTNMGSTWTLDGTPFSYQMEPLPLNLPVAGSYVVELFVMDQLTGCADSTSRVIVGNPTPTSSFTMQPVDGCGEPPILQANSTSTNGALVQWLLDGQVIGAMPSLQYPVSTAGDHTLVLIAELPGSCRDSSVVDFTTYLLPTAAFTADTACIGQSIQLTDLSTDFQGMWWYFNGVFVSTDPNTAAMIPSNLGMDTIALSVMGEGGCMDSTWRVVNVYSAPPADLLAEPLGDCTTLELDPVYVTPYASYLWTVNGLPYSQDLSTWYYYDPETVSSIPVSLTVTSVDGCTVTTSVPVDVPSCVFVPNSFTPDGDGINDLFWASIVPFDRFRSLVIYDRWGQEIVTLNRDRRTWDGTKNGEPVQIGVYNWVLLIRGEEGEPKRGHITLLR